MNPYSFGPDTSVTKSCPHCDTALEFESAGKRIVFTAHDEKFCAIGTRERVRTLERVLLAQRESYERSIANRMQAIDVALFKRGFPRLAELLGDGDVERRHAAAMAGLILSE